VALGSWRARGMVSVSCLHTRYRRWTPTLSFSWLPYWYLAASSLSSGCKSSYLQPSFHPLCIIHDLVIHLVITLSNTQFSSVRHSPHSSVQIQNVYWLRVTSQ
jgi:hypothetical protein